MRRYAEWLRTDLGRPVRWRDWPLLVRLVREARSRNSTSIADLLASRFGKSAAIGAWATGIALLDTVGEA